MGLTGATGPTGSTGATGATQSLPFAAAAFVEGNGAIGAQTGFTPPVAHTTGTGIYTLTLADPPPLDADLVVVVTAYGAAGLTATYVVSSPSTIVVNTALAGVAADAPFSIVVYNLA